MIVETGKEFMYENLVSTRIKGTQADINARLAAMFSYLHDRSVNKAGPIISTTHSIERAGDTIVQDVEYFIPVDRYVELDYKYDFKHKLRLVNAAHVRHKGQLETLQGTCAQLMTYLQEKNLHSITPLFTVMTKEPEALQGAMSEPIVDIYIGINPCIL